MAAFSCGITFTIGTSLTTGLENVMTWGGIHHKTSQTGGFASHGYPDDQYISNCNNELNAIGIPSFDICAAYIQTNHIQTSHIETRYQEEEKLLFCLMHAKHCNNTSCTIIQDCKEFKYLYHHTLYCNEPSCTIERCKKARDVLDHFDKKPQLCTYITNGSKCGVCGTVSAALKGCEAVQDSFGEIKPSDLHRYAQLSLQSSRQRDDTLFFYQEEVKSVFTFENMTCLPGIQEHIQSDRFVKFVELSHIKRPRITINTRIFQSDIYQAFVDELKAIAESASEQHYVSLVFHGTSESNIESILSNGLDPLLRRGQQYGQGEYFAASPDLPLRYCRGGTKMLVFLVITTKFDLRGQHDIVVVKKSQRQLPIATLSFLSYDPKALTAASAFQANVSKLVSEVREKEKAVKVAAAKERIIKLILEEEYLAASDIYNMSCDEKGHPPEVWAEEMAAYVRDHIRDEETVEIYFPNLPKRPKSSQDLKIRATTDIEDEAASARKKLASVTAAKGTDTSSNDNENGRDPSTNEVRQSSSSLSAGGHSSLKQNEMGGQKNMFSPGQNMPIPPQQQQQQSRRSINGNAATPSNDTDAKSRHKRQRLLLLRHASKCTAENGTCTITPQCAEMKALWKHLAYCKDSYCKVPHCLSSRYVLSHFRRCKPPCNICDPVKEIIKNGEGETPTNRKKKMKEFWFLNV